jgi:predicted metal-dependent hydrolase
MRSVPPPVQNLELRNRLGELLYKALSKSEQAMPLYALRSFGRLVEEQQRAAIRYEALIEAVAEAVREVGPLVSAKEATEDLITTGLLRHPGEVGGERWVAPGEGLRNELSSAISRVDAYCRALETVWRRPIRSEGVLERAMEEAVCLFNEGLFFEVHEVLEAVWLKEEGQVRLLLQGLIQIAAGFHHLENNNFKGALSLLKEGREKAGKFGAVCVGLELNRFLEQVKACYDSIEALGRDAFDRFDRRMIPQMRLLGPRDIPARPDR